MAGTFKFELVSPEEKLMSEDVAMVTIPGEEGVMGVLAGHSPVLSSLQMGVIEVRKNSANDNPRRIFVAGGFADIGASHCTVLAEEATDLGLVDVTRLDAEIVALTNEVAIADGHDKRRLETRLAIAEAKRAAIA